MFSNRPRGDQLRFIRSSKTFRDFWGHVVILDDLAMTFLRSRSSDSHSLMKLKVGQVGQVGQSGFLAGRLTSVANSLILTGVMAKNVDGERKEDLRRLDSAIGQVEAILDAPIPGGDVAPQVLKMARDSRLQAADRLVSLLERRAKLLGLDAPEQKPTEASGNGTLAELERKLALVGPGKAS